jgi:hypothetical protein
MTKALLRLLTTAAAVTALMAPTTAGAVIALEPARSGSLDRATQPLPQCLLAPRYGAGVPPAPAPDSRHVPPLRFGVAPDSFRWADPEPTGPPDDVRAVDRALDQLEGRRRGFILHWVDVYEPGAEYDQMPVEPLLRDGRRLSLALLFGSADGDVEGYLTHVRESVRRYAGVLESVQIHKEPDGDGGNTPRLTEAVIQGVVAAKREARRIGHPEIQVGFTSAIGEPEADPNFWTTIATAPAAFKRSIDFVGINLYSGALDPPAEPDGQPGDVRHLVVHHLRLLRECALSYAGLGKVDMHVSENGWPTIPDIFPDRTETRQAEALAIMINTINDYRGNYGITSYELFHLRDGDTDGKTDIYNMKLGIMRSDYTPKPAFHTYRDLIARLSEKHT